MNNGLQSHEGNLWQKVILSNTHKRVPKQVDNED